MWVWSAWCRASANRFTRPLCRPAIGQEWYTQSELLALGFLATKASSDVLTLSLPADLVPGVVDALDHLRDSAAAGRRGELDALEAGLSAGATLTARRDLLGELLAVAIDEAGERVAGAGSRLLRGECGAAELRTALDRLGGVLDLYDSVAG
jgi:hypothetical protein